MASSVNLKLVLEYDGRGFAGWQVQPRGDRTVQGTLIQTFQQLPGSFGPLHGAGRTDAGAHAEGQAASVTYQGPLHPERLRAALNALLPDDLAVLLVEAAPAEFHARYSATARRYRYRYLDRAARPALDRGRCWHLPRRLDAVAMAEGARLLVGRHDWTTYCAASEPEGERTREIFAASVRRRGRFVEVELVGEGFLRGLVRGIAGALAEVGQHRRSPSWVGELLAARDRRRAPRTAPACGLTLVAVEYGAR
ncbi:MAG: tRNA pseudouridine(38-40) synthase TruA [Candidatus Dormiibacterota bacterium]